MEALCLMFSDERKALIKAVDLSLDWNVVVTGPVDGCEVRQDGEYLSTASGTWLVVASKEKFEAP